MKPSLLISCDFYLPGYKAGGPVRSLAPIVDNLKNDFDITIITRNHDLVTEAPYPDVCSNQLNERQGVHVLYLSEKNIVRGLYHFLKNKIVDVFYINTFFSPKFSILPLLLVRCGVFFPHRIIIAPRGELGDGALLVKSFRKKFFLKCYRFLFPMKKIEWHATSENEKSEIKMFFGEHVKITLLSNLPAQQLLNAITHLKQADQLKIIFLSRIAKKKNILFALDVLSKVSGSVQFDLYGPIHHPDYWQLCLEKIKQLPKNISVTYHGDLSYETVHQTMQQYDLFFLPTLNENYGHVIVEALSAGVPVLLSDQTPWHDVEKYHAGWVFPLSDEPCFIERIQKLILCNQEQYAQYQQGALDYVKARVRDTSFSEAYRIFFSSTTK